ncbi:deoxycytidylate deaminase [Oerskovia enterophila]
MSPKVIGQVGPRPNWDQWALGIAHAVASRADCTRRQVGAVAHGPDHRVLGTGYNGAPSGRPGCATAGACPRGRFGYDAVASRAPYSSGGDSTCDALHAEENAVLHLSPAERAGATIYVTDEPCPNCTRLLAGAGIARVVWPTGEIEYSGA